MEKKSVKIMIILNISVQFELDLIIYLKVINRLNLCSWPWEKVIKIAEILETSGNFLRRKMGTLKDCSHVTKFSPIFKSKMSARYSVNNG